MHDFAPPRTKTITHPSKLQAAAQQLQDAFDQEDKKKADAMNDGNSETTEPKKTESKKSNEKNESDLFQPTEYLADLNKKISNQDIKEFFDELEEIETKRQALNDRKSSAMQALVDKGAEKAGLNAAYQRYKQQNKTRQAKIDATFARCSNAMGAGYQAGLFSDE